MLPPFLRYNDKVTIISPSGNIDEKYIDGTIERLKSWNLRPEVGQFARTQNGRFAGTVEQRIADLQAAIDNPEIKAIFCSRGGYGLMQVIDQIDLTAFEINPKWIVGFSDISVLHAATTAIEVASVHSIMAKHLAELPQDAEQIKLLHDILYGRKDPEYKVPAHELNRQGEVKSTIVGGNLSVLFGLRGSHFDLDTYHKIFFIEDVGEEPYKIDRMMQNLKISGVLENLTGLIVGQFSDYEEDPQLGKTVYEIIADAVSEYDYPVCFNFPAGHVDYNLPFVLGAEATLNVKSSGASLTYCFDID